MPESQTKGFLISTGLTALIICIVATVATFVFSTQKQAISVVFGFLIALVSLIALAVSVVAAFSKGKKAYIAGALGIIKMGIIGFVIWLLISGKIAEPLSLMVGFSTVVLALLIVGLRYPKK